MQPFAAGQNFNKLAAPQDTLIVCRALRAILATKHTPFQTASDQIVPAVIHLVLLDIKAVYDLSATPFAPTGRTNTEAGLFGWVVSDFGLNDSIEAGLVKTPRVVEEL